MESKEKRALNKFADEIIRDLEPSSTFLHMLFARNILTEEHIDIINGIASREQKVTNILQILPRRGPEAFAVFKSCLGKDYPWLEDKLANEVQRLKEGQIGINKKFVNTIQLKLDPLVYGEDEDVEVCTESTHPNKIVKKLGDSLTDLEKRCYRALCLTIGPKKVPLPQLIERRLTEAKRQEKPDRHDEDNKAAEAHAALSQSLKAEKVQLQERLTTINKELVSTEAILLPLVYNGNEIAEKGLTNKGSSSTIKRINDTIVEHQQRCLKALDLKQGHSKVPLHALISKRLREERGKDIAENSERSKDLRKMNKQNEDTRKDNESLKKKVEYLREKQKQLLKTSKDLKKCQQENEQLKEQNQKMRGELAAIREKPKDGACITDMFL